MFRSPSVKIALGVVLVLAVLAILHLRHEPGSMDEEAFHRGATQGVARQTLTVAFVPVTCHLTCPVTDFASKTSTTGTEFDALRFTEFPTIAEALTSKKLEAAFLTVPLAMKLREKGVPIKICCLGHRDGSEVMVRKDLPGTSLRDMKGRTFAIPGPYSNENFFLRTLMRQQGLQPDDIKIVVMPPPDMPTALRPGGIDGFVVAEPFCSKAELDGSGRVLYYAKDIWPHYISCALAVHEDLIRDNPEVVQDLVRGIVDSGEWTERNRADAARLVAPYFRQDPKLLNYVLTHPRDRVTYRMLTPGDDEMQRIEDIGIGLGVLKKRIPMSELMDKRFIPKDIVPVKIDMSKLGTVPIAGKS
ncbi:MAG: ABC transporter substrate-binding protein [Armatimonadetes bacterium]|nr:ABC transporter substrate-binding protein [Armatimonadota bacterium]